MDTTCDTCKVCQKEHYPLSSTTGMCLYCGMKARKSADIKKLKAEAIAEYNEKVEGVNF